MAPAPSKASKNTPVTVQAESRKRKPSFKITDKNFTGAESNVVTKRLKQSAEAAQAASSSVKRKASVQDDDDSDDEDTIPLNIPPKNPNVILEAANGTDDVDMLDNNPAPVDLDADEMEVAETEEDQLSESNK